MQLINLLPTQKKKKKKKKKISIYLVSRDVISDCILVIMLPYLPIFFTVQKFKYLVDVKMAP